MSLNTEIEQDPKSDHSSLLLPSVDKEYGSRSSFSLSMGVNSQEHGWKMFAPALFKIHEETGAPRFLRFRWNMKLVRLALKRTRATP